MDFRSILSTLLYPLIWIVNCFFWVRPNPFLRILAGSLPADYLHQDSECVCFRDIRPAADFHALVVPRKPITSWKELTVADLPLLERMVEVAGEVARAQGIQDPLMGFMTPPYNSVFQLHLHILSRPLTDRGLRGMCMSSWWLVSPAYVYVALRQKKNE